MTESGPRVEQSLTEVVWDLLDAESGLDENAKYAVIAALESAEALREQIDGSAAPVERPSTDDAEVVEPLGAYLKSITVAGFRGIGPRATLEVSPYPGITVISGRNGSGKSSFAEGLEFALTGQSYRWRNRAKMWADSWRNLHQPNPCEVRVEFAVPGAKVTTAGVDWADGANLTGSETWTQVAGEKRQPGTDSLGWSNALDIYRPLLTYDEIGGLLDQEPSKLYDALATLLGLEEIQDAEKRLADLLSERKQPRAVATTALRDLKAVLQGADDARAVEAAKLLKKRQPDLDVVTALVSGADSPQTKVIATLRGIAEIAVPDLDGVVSATSALRQKESKALQLADQALDSAEHRSALLRRALEYRDTTDDEQCPVCGVGVLDDEWKQHTREFLITEDQRLSDYRAAQTELKQARAAVDALSSGLVDVAQVDGVQLPSLDAYSAAVAAARARPDDVGRLADHADQVVPSVVHALMELQAEVTAAAASLEDAWAPIAAKINGWLSLEHTARSADDVVARLDAAKKWVTANANVLRNQRMQPIADRAREIWSQLRQESNVDISSITLQGQRTHRKAVLEGSVDGQSAAALTVMSQGELHALALALFIPRATAQASPFRFIVLDDPIQAMDPAKIEGFISVLRTLAESRQVIVFSHDDRLAASIRQLGVPAQLLEVTRETGSSITVKTADHPAKRYADDAFALVADDKVGDEIKRRAAPGLFRLALESAAQQVFYAKRAASGRPHFEAELEWETYKKTNQRIALAVLGDATADISAWRSYRQHRFPVMTISTKGSHGNIPSVTKDDVRDLHKTVDDILAET